MSTEVFEIARDDAVKLGSQLIRFVEEPCCEVPMLVDNPACVWHGYRSLLRKLAELIPHARAVETRAQAHVLRFAQKTVLASAAAEAAQGADAMGVVSRMADGLNDLIQSLEK